MNLDGATDRDDAIKVAWLLALLGPDDLLSKSPGYLVEKYHRVRTAQNEWGLPPMSGERVIAFNRWATFWGLPTFDSRLGLIDPPDTKTVDAVVPGRELESP